QPASAERPGAAAAGATSLLHGRRADRRRHRRHPGARRQPGVAADHADDDRSERDARAERERADRTSGRASQRDADSAFPERQRRADGDDGDRFHLAASRRPDAVGAGQRAGPQPRREAARRPIRARPPHLEDHRGAGRAGDRRAAHQRPVLRLRRRRGRRQDGGKAARDQGRADRRQQLSRARRDQSGRAHRRFRHTEARRRRPDSSRRRPGGRAGAGGAEAAVAVVADTFIRRPILASVFALVIILAGVMAIPTLPIAQFPELAPPQVTVVAFYNGANAETVESAVTLPLEQAINGVEGMQYMTSTSGNDGSSAITVTFDITRDLDVAAVDVQNRISQAEGRLPNEVKQVGISVTKVSSNFVLAAAAYAEKGEYDPLFISNYVDRFVVDEIKRVPGVGNVFVFGVGRYAMRLWVDPNKLAGRNITADEVVQALREQNVQVAAGAVGADPAPKGQAYQISVRAEGRLNDPEQFEDIILKRSNDGALVRVRDVGRTELGAESYTTASRFNARDAIGFGVLQLPTANSLQVYREVMATIDRLSQRFPPGFKIEVAFDTTSVVSESIREVVTTLLEAIGLVVLVMFLFLRNWRTTLIPAMTIPVSLVGTFAFVKLFGFSINTLTLFGITLATGLVVDDAIVVIENIERHIHERHLKNRDHDAPVDTYEASSE